MQRKIRYGVVGLGHIAQVAVLPAFKHANKNSELTALITGDSDKAEKLSAKYKVKHTFNYDELDELVKSDVVDALYICLPNNLHTDISVRALKSGLHVLCEKPLALKVSDARKLYNAAKIGRTKLMTAYRLHFEEANIKALELCKAGKLGDLRYFSSNFSFEVTDPNNIRLRQEMGGGPVWDIGIYCINAVRNLFQSEPTEVFAMAAKGKSAKFKDVEEAASVILKFPGERMATFNCSFGATATASYCVYGTKGSIWVENAYEYAEQRKLVFTDEKEKSKTFKYKKADQFAPEIIYFSECIQKNRQPEPSVFEGAADIRVIQAIYKSIRTQKMVSLEPLGKLKNSPSKDMKMFYPGFEKPKAVHANSPHN